MSARDRAAAAVEELAALVAAVSPEEVDALVDAIRPGRRVYLAGFGRSGLVARAFAMRLMHLGLDAAVVGETATPAIGRGDLLIVLSSSGGGAPARAQLETAVAVGAEVVTMSAHAEVPLAALGARVLVVPARTGVATEQHAGSLFEQGCLVIADAICSELKERLGVTTAEMDARHANLQ
jgi:6-phospho-3-hexuloisomerase